MKALVLTEHYQSQNEIEFHMEERPIPTRKPGQCLVQVHALGINPSDVLGALGYFSHAKLPRIPGRDFSGVVVEGSSSLVGKKVWGTGGAAGLDTDGALTEYIILPETAIAEIPSTLSLIEAGAQPLPFVTAYYGLVSRAKVQKGETVLVIGGLGQVGRAAMSICEWKGSNPVALVRKSEDVQKAKAFDWTAVERISSEYDVILNTVGTVYWEEQVKALKRFGRMVVIAAPEGKREALFNLFNFYRANQEICGVNSVDFDYSENAQMLNELKSGFETGALRPLPVDHTHVFPLEKGAEAFKLVLDKSQGKRIVIQLAT